MVRHARWACGVLSLLALAGQMAGATAVRAAASQGHISGRYRVVYRLVRTSLGGNPGTHTFTKIWLATPDCSRRPCGFIVRSHLAGKSRPVRVYRFRWSGLRWVSEISLSPAATSLGCVAPDRRVIHNAFSESDYSALDASSVTASGRVERFTGTLTSRLDARAGRPACRLRERVGGLRVRRHRCAVGTQRPPETLRIRRPRPSQGPAAFLHRLGPAVPWDAAARRDDCVRHRASRRTHLTMIESP